MHSLIWAHPRIRPSICSHCKSGWSYIPTILNVVGQLISSSLLLKTDISYYPGRRSVTLYVLVPPDEAPRPTGIEISKLAASQLELPMAELLVQKAVQLRYDPVLDRNMPWKGERLIVFNLTALLPADEPAPRRSSSARKSDRASATVRPKHGRPPARWWRASWTCGRSSCC
jgi:hypothetical protein